MSEDRKPSKLKSWVEAMRLRTLPVSLAGVICGVGVALQAGCFKAAPAVLCIVFAVLAQISSNFANEYYDYKSGLDRPGREGPRRGVTEGDISPGAMKGATYGVLCAACCCGLSLIAWGGWWLIAVGALIAVGVVAYSAGPYPLSRHALGELAVIFFFGIIPVNFTYYLQAGAFSTDALLASVSMGLMGANVLIVNNYRDADADAAVGKVTLAVKWGRRDVLNLYRADSVVAALVMLPLWTGLSRWAALIPVAYLLGSWLIAHRMERTQGRALNPYLGRTALLMLAYALLYLVACLAK